MIRTTIRLPEELLAEAQQRARDTGRTFTDLLADALRYELRRATIPPTVCEPLPTYGGRGVRDGVDLNDNAALEDHMNGS
ncbi:MAG: CopG family transcriptional regulator [Phycisphaerae bacterium]|nr:CopG family transcriptional regulator [Gemmatimonadaceae bacterium]